MFVTKIVGPLKYLRHFHTTRNIRTKIDWDENSKICDRLRREAKQRDNQSILNAGATWCFISSCYGVANMKKYMVITESIGIINNKICALIIDSCIFGTVTCTCIVGLGLFGVIWLFSCSYNPMFYLIFMLLTFFIVVYMCSNDGYMYRRLSEKEKND
uniref:Uncharacterized protein n=1 Tax=viral metagenome TaxID=1070528 RepID=A0A6C0CC63_9ZZZZ